MIVRLEDTGYVNKTNAKISFNIIYNIFPSKGNFATKSIGKMVHRVVSIVNEISCHIIIYKCKDNTV